MNPNNLVSVLVKFKIQSKEIECIVKISERVEKAFQYFPLEPVKCNRCVENGIDPCYICNFGQLTFTSIIRFPCDFEINRNVFSCFIKKLKLRQVDMIGIYHVYLV